MEHGEINKCLAAAEHIKAVCRDAANELKEASLRGYGDLLRALEADWDRLPGRCPPLTTMVMANMALGHDTARQRRAAAPYADALRKYMTEQAKVHLAPIDQEIDWIIAHLDDVIASVQKDLAACGLDIDLGAGIERRQGRHIRNMASFARRSLINPILDDGPWGLPTDPMIDAVLLAARQTPVSRFWLSFLQPMPLTMPRMTALFWTTLRRIVIDDMSQSREQALSRFNSDCAAISQEGAAIARDIRAGLPGGDLS